MGILLSTNLEESNVRRDSGLEGQVGALLLQLPVITMVCDEAMVLAE